MISAIKALEKRNDIISAEPDYIVQTAASPNDSYYVIGDQWGLYNSIGISPPYGINTEKAWDHSVGNSNLLVGVIDSGIDAKHPDLINNINDNLHRDYVDHPLITTYRDVAKSDLEDLNGENSPYPMISYYS